MPQEDMEALIHRIQRLERANSRFRMIGLGVLLAMVALAAVLSHRVVVAQSRVIEVERLILRDQQGVVRAELSMAPGFGETNFSLNDRNGKPLIVMGGVDGTAIISMLDATGKERLYMRVGPDALGNDRGPIIWLFDGADNRVWGAP